MTLEHSLTAVQWLSLLAHFAGLSLLAVGGAITAVPDMHRYLVTEQRWLTDAQFSSSIALAQAAPGPNVLFIALLGWNVGLNSAAAGGQWAWASAALGLTMAMAGILIPSSLLTYRITRWAHHNRELLPVRAFKTGMAPLVVALMMATGWLLTRSTDPQLESPGIWLLALTTALLVWRTRIHMLWLLGAGAAVGGLGWV